ncbi:MAG: hypothetical protein ACTIDT_01005 [Halomonas sp.]|uniref:hypothetical protein n=1 Tax=unclassified Halomonas TaxID=2609666 RepID=UPI003FB83CCB
MSEPHIVEFDIDNESGSDPCSSMTRGLVLTVEKCRDHNHFISIKSLGTTELESKDLVSLLAKNGIDLEVDGGAKILVRGGGKVDIDTILVVANEGMIIQSDMAIEGDVVIDGDLSVTGDINVAGNVEIDGYIKAFQYL